METNTLYYFYNNIQNIFNASVPKIYYVVHSQTEINTGNENDCNLQYCIDNKIPVYKMNRDGGTIVCSKGNIGVTSILPIKYGWQCPKFIQSFTSWLKSFNLNISTDKNDILIDGYKVASCVEKRVGDNLKNIYSTFQFNIYQDIEVIRQVCQKEVVKIPKALNDYGFTTDDILTFVKNYFEQIEKKF